MWADDIRASLCGFILKRANVTLSKVRRRKQRPKDSWLKHEMRSYPFQSTTTELRWPIPKRQKCSSLSQNRVILLNIFLLHRFRKKATLSLDCFVCKVRTFKYFWADIYIYISLDGFLWTKRVLRGVWLLAEYRHSHNVASTASKLFTATRTSSSPVALRID